MILMHSRPKEQREAIRQLVHSVLTRDMGTFNPERFKEWIKDIDARFRKVGLTSASTINERAVSFTIKEIRSGRTAFKFTASSHVPFEDRDVVMSVEEFGQRPALARDHGQFGSIALQRSGGRSMPLAAKAFFRGGHPISLSLRHDSVSYHGPKTRALLALAEPTLVEARAR